MKQDVITTVGQWINRFAKQRSDAEKLLIQQAADLLADKDQFSHVNPALGRAGIVAELHMDIHCILAALLADHVKNSYVEEEVIGKSFGQPLIQLINGINAALDHIDASLREVEHKPQQIEQLRRMLLASVDDVRVLLVCLADRLQCLRQAASLSSEQKQELAEETMKVYAPLANRLGLGQVKWEMEDWAFRFLNPEQYHRIAKMLDERRTDRERFIQQFVSELETALEREGIRASIRGRAKHIFSIWRKMQKKGQDFHQLFDIRAVRVLVDTEVQCYTVLGIVHTHWQAIPGEFDDYIAVPKENNYQSLHTAVIGPDNKTVEVQIRTREMHENAEFGVAAHWAYKEGKNKQAFSDRRLLWLRGLIESLTDSGDEAGSVALQEQLDEKRVYVLTPKGEILDFPQHATPLDFAYTIHTEVGHRCRGAKVNGRIVPLNYQLSNGDRVEILTTKVGGPSRDWLNPDLGYIRTARARSKIREWFNKEDYEDNVAAGRTAVEREFRRLNYTGVNYEQLAKHFQLSTDDMFAKVGRGELTAAQVGAILGRDKQETVPTARPRVDHPEGAVRVEGVGNLLTHLATCCKPIAHDDIVGYITVGRGVTVHRADCPNVLKMKEAHRDRLIEVEWAEEAAQRYGTEIHIKAFHRHGLIKDITSVLSNEKIGVQSIQMQSDQKDHTAEIHLAVEITGVDQLTRILARIGQLPNVLSVQRR